MITVNGRFAAIAVMTLTSGAVVAIGVYAAVVRRLTVREALLGGVLLVVAVVARLWLWRHPAGGRS